MTPTPESAEAPLATPSFKFGEFFNDMFNIHVDTAKALDPTPKGDRRSHVVSEASGSQENKVALVWDSFIQDMRDVFEPRRNEMGSDLYVDDSDTEEERGSIDSALEREKETDSKGDTSGMKDIIVVQSFDNSSSLRSPSRRQITADRITVAQASKRLRLGFQCCAAPNQTIPHQLDISEASSEAPLVPEVVVSPLPSSPPPRLSAPSTITVEKRRFSMRRPSRVAEGADKVLESLQEEFPDCSVEELSRYPHPPLNPPLHHPLTPPPSFAAQKKTSALVIEQFRNHLTWRAGSTIAVYRASYNMQVRSGLRELFLRLERQETEQKLRAARRARRQHAESRLVVR